MRLPRHPLPWFWLAFKLNVIEMGDNLARAPSHQTSPDFGTSLNARLNAPCMAVFVADCRLRPERSLNTLLIRPDADTLQLLDNSCPKTPRRPVVPECELAAPSRFFV